MTREQFIARVKETAYLTGEFTLRSGKKSSYYLDKYRFETHPDILAYLGKAFAEYADSETTCIGGPELGGVALAAAASLASGLRFVIIRNAKKEYGTSKLFEGVLEPNEHVLLVEDIATTGGQVLEAAKALEDSGAVVQRIVAVIDRLEGARENIEGAGFSFDSIITSEDLGIPRG